MPHRFFKILTMAAFVLLAGVGVAQATSPVVPMLAVDVKKGQIQEKPAIPAEDIRVSYMGVLYEKPLPVSPVKEANNKSADTLIAQMIKVNSKGNPIAMASIFMPDERARVMDSYQDPKLLKPNMAFFRTVTGADLDGYVIIDNVIYLFVTFHAQDDRPLVVPTVRTKAGYFLTNKLANQSTMAELSAAYAHGQIQTLQ